jgi:hypothetical protein
VPAIKIRIEARGVSEPMHEEPFIGSGATLSLLAAVIKAHRLICVPAASDPI